MKRLRKLPSTIAMALALATLASTWVASCVHRDAESGQRPTTTTVPSGSNSAFAGLASQLKQVTRRFLDARQAEIARQAELARQQQAKPVKNDKPGAVTAMPAPPGQAGTPSAAPGETLTQGLDQIAKEVLEEEDTTVAANLQASEVDSTAHALLGPNTRTALTAGGATLAGLGLVVGLITVIRTNGAHGQKFDGQPLVTLGSKYAGVGPVDNWRFVAKVNNQWRYITKGETPVYADANGPYLRGANANEKIFLSYDEATGTVKTVPLAPQALPNGDPIAGFVGRDKRGRPVWSNKGSEFFVQIDNGIGRVWYTQKGKGVTYSENGLPVIRNASGTMLARLDGEHAEPVTVEGKEVMVSSQGYTYIRGESLFDRILVTADPRNGIGRIVKGGAPQQQVNVELDDLTDLPVIVEGRRQFVVDQQGRPLEVEGKLRAEVLQGQLVAEVDTVALPAGAPKHVKLTFNDGKASIARSHTGERLGIDFAQGNGKVTEVPYRVVSDANLQARRASLSAGTGLLVGAGISAALGAGAILYAQLGLAANKDAAAVYLADLAEISNQRLALLNRQ